MIITSNIIIAMMKDREAVHSTKLLMVVMDFVMATMIMVRFDTMVRMTGDEGENGNSGGWRVESWMTLMTIIATSPSPRPAPWPVPFSASSPSSSRHHHHHHHHYQLQHRIHPHHLHHHHHHHHIHNTPTSGSVRPACLSVFLRSATSRVFRVRRP